MVNKMLTSVYFFLSIFFQSCNGEEPSIKEIAGVWNNADGAQIHLKEDGTFIGKNLPSQLFFAATNEYNDKQFKGTGNWIIRKEQSFWEVQLNFKETSNQHYRYGHSVLISGEKGILENHPPWYLFLWKEEQGGERYEFKKIK